MKHDFTKTFFLCTLSLCARTALAAPSHYYSYHEDQRYGYESALSQADIQQGIQGNTMVMATYAGRKNNKIRLIVSNQGVTTYVECVAPCEFATLNPYGFGVTYRLQAIRVPRESVLFAVISDALHGELQQYAPTSRESTEQTQ